MSTLLGAASDGRALTYDADLYEFSLDGEPASFDDVQMLDARNWMTWRADVLRDWFRRIVPADLEACNRRARASASAEANRPDGRQVGTLAGSGSLVAEAQLAGDAPRDARGSISVSWNGQLILGKGLERGVQTIDVKASSVGPDGRATEDVVTLTVNVR